MKDQICRTLVYLINVRPKINVIKNYSYSGGASTHFRTKKIPRHFGKNGNFLPTYVVGVLGEAYFYLGDA